MLQHQQHAQGERHQGHIAEKAAVDGRARAQKRVTLEEAYGSSSQEDGDEPREAHKEEDDASSASELDVKGLDQVPDSDCSSDASMASEAESPSPPSKRKVCQDGPPSQVAGRMTKCYDINLTLEYFTGAPMDAALISMDAASTALMRCRCHAGVT